MVKPHVPSLIYKLRAGLHGIVGQAGRGRGHPGWAWKLPVQLLVIQMFAEVHTVMSEKEKLVAVLSPWEKLSELVKRQFRVESMPGGKLVMVWRDDLQTEDKLTAELRKLGVNATEVTKRQPTEWKHVG
jgi:hypothetical protein